MISVRHRNPGSETKIQNHSKHSRYHELYFHVGFLITKSYKINTEADPTGCSEHNNFVSQLRNLKLV